MLDQFREHAQFLRAFVRNPTLTGAIAPSSTRLAGVITDDIGLEEASIAVELGPGTGAFTARIARRLPPQGTLIAVEANDRMVDRLRGRFDADDVDIAHADVAELRRALASRDLRPGRVDCVVSGLPWAAFEPRRQSRLLDAVTTELRPDARFATFTYLHSPLLPAGRDFARRLRDRFDRVGTSDVVWRNLPPAFVYRCRP